MRPSWCRRPTLGSEFPESCCQEQGESTRGALGGAPGLQQGLMWQWRDALRWLQRQRRSLDGTGDQVPVIAARRGHRPRWPLQQRLLEGPGGQGPAITVAR
jgi:hypothetical protein